MMQIIKKITTYLLILLVLFFTVVSLLGIWEIINLEAVMMKSLKSLLIVFISSAIVLFILHVFQKQE